MAFQLFLHLFLHLTKLNKSSKHDRTSYGSYRNSLDHYEALFEKL
jgi:hypothetical protein